MEDGLRNQWIWLAFNWKLDVDFEDIDEKVAISYLNKLISDLKKIWETNLANIISWSEVRLQRKWHFRKRWWRTIYFNESETIRTQERWTLWIVISIQNRRKPNMMFNFSLSFSSNLSIDQEAINKIIETLKIIDSLDPEVAKEIKKSSDWVDSALSKKPRRTFETLKDNYIDFSIDNLSRELWKLEIRLAELLGEWSKDIDNEVLFNEISELEIKIPEIRRVLSLLETERDFRKNKA